jgi:regulator of replication initiation timing
VEVNDVTRDWGMMSGSMIHLSKSVQALVAAYEALKAENETLKKKLEEMAPKPE